MESRCISNVISSMKVGKVCQCEELCAFFNHKPKKMCFAQEKTKVLCESCNRMIKSELLKHGNFKHFRLKYACRACGFMKQPGFTFCRSCTCYRCYEVILKWNRIGRVFIVWCLKQLRIHSNVITNHFLPLLEPKVCWVAITAHVTDSNSIEPLLRSL